MSNPSVRINKNARKIIEALNIAFHKKPTAPGGPVINYLIEYWLNSAPDEYIPLLANAGCTLTVPGYYTDYRQPPTPGEKPDFISISKYVPKERMVEIKQFMDMATGQIVIKKVSDRDEDDVEDVYFDKQLGGKIPIVNESDEVDTPTGEKVKLFRNIKTDEDRFVSYNIEYKPLEDEREIWFVIDLKTQVEREIIIPKKMADFDPDFSADEVLIELYRQEDGSVEKFWINDIEEREDDEDEEVVELLIGNQPTNTTPDPAPEAPSEFYEIKGSDVLRAGK